MTRLVGRSAFYRLGRALYMKARGETPNSISTNGEHFVQQCVASAWESGRMRAQRLRVFDIGANVGDWSLALLSSLTSTQQSHLDLHAFEPTPATFVTLSRRLASVPFVHCEPLALSSDIGVRVLFSKGANAGTNSLDIDRLAEDVERVSVQTTTVARYCRQNRIDHVHLLKCDTEGHDMEVIRGAKEMLDSQAISVLQFEYNHRWIFSRHFLRDAFLAIAGLPYVFAKLQPDRLLIFSEWHPELDRFFEGNYALVHESALPAFPTQYVTWNRSNSMSVVRLCG
jgi:FkbM family methyltransferase